MMTYFTAKSHRYELISTTFKNVMFGYTETFSLEKPLHLNILTFHT